MSIITTTPPPAVPAEQQMANSIKTQINNLYQQMSAVFERADRFIWQRPNHTPQQGFDAFGTDAGDLLKIGDLYRELVAGYTGKPPASPVPQGCSAKTNADGTVSVTGQPAAPTAAVKPGSAKASAVVRNPKP